ncbi:MAG: hypothetical protein QXW38_08495 [Candidatus Nitrosotenuis sp.]
MKVTLAITAFVLFFLALAWATDFWSREKEYNAHVCAVYGYQPDCKTKLEREE